MATTTTPAHAVGTDAPPSTRLRWVMYAAAAWSLAYGLVALGWTVTGRGFPLGENDPDPQLSMFDGLPANIGAPLFAAVALAGAGIAVLMARWPDVATVSAATSSRRHYHVLQARSQLRSWWRRILVVAGMLTALGWAVVVPDARVLAFLGYLPMIIVQAPFDAEMRATLADTLNSVYLNHLAVLGGGALWAVASAVFARRTAGSCVRCGRGQVRSRCAEPAAAARWGWHAVLVAMTIPAIYAVTRWVWVAGYPLGFDDEAHAEGMADGSMWSGAWLGTFALVGSVLTMGLVQRWGEVFPRWMLGLRGRRVPIKLAVIPASLVSVLVTSGGLSLIKVGLSEGLLEFSADNWAAIGPSLLWPLWGVALAVATYAYYLRRRGGCSDCGRTDELLAGADTTPERVTNGGRRAPGPAGPESH